MGFRSLQGCNLALLAKQSWRILDEPNSLWVRVLKGRYFPNRYFRDAVKGGRASLAWASILDVRNIIMQGAHGSSTRIWMDKWILHLYGNRVQPVLRAKLNMDMNVEDIIDHENGIWNLAPIRHLISAEEENAILNTPFGSKGASDLLIWLSERNGRYSVRSRYHWLQSRISSSSLHSPSISSTTTPKLWKLLWKIQALGRSPLPNLLSTPRIH
ncbi:unnamed protein product [Prunus armeniaca]